MICRSKIKKSSATFGSWNLRSVCQSLYLEGRRRFRDGLLRLWCGEGFLCWTLMTFCRSCHQHFFLFLLDSRLRLRMWSFSPIFQARWFYVRSIQTLWLDRSILSMCTSSSLGDLASLPFCTQITFDSQDLNQSGSEGYHRPRLILT